MIEFSNSSEEVRVNNRLLESKHAVLAPVENWLASPLQRFSGHQQHQETVATNHTFDGRLGQFFNGAMADSVSDVLQGALLQPVGEIVGRQGKRLRGQLVRMCYRLVSDEPAPSLLASRRCQIGAEVIELIHAGSLIIDDIEDGSQVRRGAPALHLQYGIPVALNAGNWLYFWPFQLLKDMEMSDDRLLLLYERYHSTLLKAHTGQAIDLGARVDRQLQDRVLPTCLSALKLKTGALMGFAALIGGAISGVPRGLLNSLDDFGCDLGVALQMFDDLGNLIGKCEPSKQYEDLALSRPSWVWACAATHLSAVDYRRFVAAVRQLPDAAALESLLSELGLAALARTSARHHLDLAFATLQQYLESTASAWSYPAFKELRQLGEGIAIAYG
jgi:geranylgeranyl pyrophosphate synthase